MPRKQKPSEPLHTIITRLMISQEYLFTALVVVIIAASSHWGAQIATRQMRLSTLLIANSVSDFLNNSEHALTALAVSQPTQPGLDAVRAGFNEFDVIYYILSDGRLEKVSPRTGLITVGMDMSSQPYFQTGLNTIVISAPFTSPHTGKATVYMSVPLLQGDGMIVGEVNLSQLQNRISGNGVATTGIIYLIDQNGYYLAHPDPNKVARHEDLRDTKVYRAALEGKEDPIYTWSDTIYVNIIQKIPGTDWFTITQTPFWIVFGPSLLPALLSLLLALILIIIGMRQQRHILTRRVIEPLKTLTDQARRISAGTYIDFTSHPPAPEAYAEVNILMNSFRLMEDAVKNRESDNYKLLFDVQRHLRQERLLREIDTAITSIRSLDATMNAILTRINSRFGIDASSLYLFESGTRELKVAHHIGFMKNPDPADLALFETTVKKVAAEGKLYRIANLEKTRDAGLKAVYRKENLRSYICIPLHARNQMIGILNLFTRSVYAPADDELDFLKLIGLHTALAVDSTRLFTDLQTSNLEMAKAYDSTLEGWSRAMDLRDRETEGHTQRVTELTEKLARMVGVTEEDLIQVRRGALLHDIGKIGVPDSILLKPGPLTSEEWETMRRHPQYARDFLMPIEYLRPALDIPVHHHEHWDGSGYPDHLAGKDIPLAARIFSVIDVWDALTSDRPYRSAWQTDKAMEYILSAEGEYFDPAIVKAFLKLLAGQPHPLQPHSRSNSP